MWDNPIRGCLLFTFFFTLNGCSGLMRQKPNTTQHPENIILTVKHDGGSITLEGCSSSANILEENQFLSTRALKLRWFSLFDTTQHQHWTVRYTAKVSVSV